MSTIFPGIYFLLLPMAQKPLRIFQTTKLISYTVIFNTTFIKAIFIIEWGTINQVGRVGQLTQVLWIGYCDVAMQSCLEFHPFLG